MGTCEAGSSAVGADEYVLLHHRIGEHRLLQIGSGHVHLVQSNVNKTRTCEVAALQLRVDEHHAVERGSLKVPVFDSDVLEFGVLQVGASEGRKRQAAVGERDP